MGWCARTSSGGNERKSAYLAQSASKKPLINLIFRGCFAALRGHARSHKEMRHVRNNAASVGAGVPAKGCAAPPFEAQCTHLAHLLQSPVQAALRRAPQKQREGIPDG
ncbi:hypothetical protein E5221_23810 [Pseudomonas sp. A2]|nr:hypothetical protein E5221_23810 [Pseudomonas sp. A2]